MKRQISNEQTLIAQVLLVVIGVTLPYFILSFFINNLSNIVQGIIVALSFLLGLTCLYYSTKLYAVSFDNDFIYFSRLREMKKIDAGKVTNIQSYVFPLRLFYRNVYLMKIVYTDNDGERKVYFLSKGEAGRVGTVNNIPFVDTLRELIRNKKYR